MGFARQWLKPGFGFRVEGLSGVDLPRWPHPGFNPLPERSHRTAPDIGDALWLNCTLAKQLSIRPSGPTAGYHTEQGQFIRKGIFLKNKVVWVFFPSEKPARQSDSMHEENIYADEQRGLFKSKVKEQLFCSSILMLAKNRQKDHTQPRKQHWQWGVTLAKGP